MTRHPIRAVISAWLLVTLTLPVLVPGLPVERWRVTPFSAELTAGDLSVSSPCTPEREKQSGEKFLKGTAVGVPVDVLTRPGIFSAPETADGHEHLRIAALLVYTQTTSSRL